MSLAPSFGAACRDAVAGRSRRSGAALVDLTDGLTTIQEPLSACRGRVRSETHGFYIGITEDPTRRFEEHCLTRSWIEMVVLAKARSSRETSYLERSLISEFGHVHRCSNVGPGGNGRPMHHRTSCTWWSASTRCRGDPAEQGVRLLMMCHSSNHQQCKI